MFPSRDLVEAFALVSATSALKLIHDKMKGKSVTLLSVMFQYIAAFIVVYVAQPVISGTELALLWTVILSVSSAHLFEFLSSSMGFKIVLDAILRFFNLKSKDGPAL